MNATSRGIRNAFRNNVRTLSVVVILGLSIGLALAMLVAHQSVGQKINSVKSSVGNTITIAPAGFSNFSQANNALTTSQLSKVQSLPHVSSLSESLTDRLTTIGSSQPSFGGFGNSNNSSSTNNQTSLTSPVTLNTGGNGGGGRFFSGGNGSLPTNFSLPITIVGSNDPTQINGTSLSLKSGSFIDGSKDSDNALISDQMASKNDLKVGSTFTAYGSTLTVSGIFNSNSNRGLADQVIVALPTEQRLSGQTGDITSATATVDSIDNLNSTTTSIKNTLGSSADVTNDQTTVNNTVSSLNNIKSISLYSLIGAVIAGAVIIFLTMLMIVRERRIEIGVTKAIGASNFKIVWQFMTEALTLTILAAVVGIVIGVVAADPITKTLVNNANSSSQASSASTPAAGGLANRFGGAGGGGFITTRGAGGGGFVARGRGLGAFRSNITNIHAAVGWTILLYGLLAALAIALIGSAIASWSIAKVRPAEVMRAE